MSILNVIKTKLLSPNKDKIIYPETYTSCVYDETSGERLDNILKWKLHTSVIGATLVTLPTNWEELNVVVKARPEIANSYDYVFHIVKSMLNDGYSDHYCRIGGNLDMTDVIIDVKTNNTLFLYRCKDSGTSYSDSAKTTIYYR